MPKLYYTPRQLPSQQPDRCELCPLIGKIPPDEREKGVREAYYCLGIFQAEPDERGELKMTFPRLKSKGIKSSAQAWKEMGHRLHRPCDLLWDSWMTLPGRLYGMPTDTYTKYRLPYEHEQQIKNFPKFNFRRKSKK